MTWTKLIIKHSMKHHFDVSFSDYSFPNAFKLNAHPHVLLSRFRMNELKRNVNLISKTLFLLVLYVYVYVMCMCMSMSMCIWVCVYVYVYMCMCICVCVFDVQWTNKEELMVMSWVKWKNIALKRCSLDYYLAFMTRTLHCCWGYSV